MERLVSFALLLGSGSLAGCFASHDGGGPSDGDGDADADIDADTDTDADGGVEGCPPPTPAEAVDLLVVIDDSRSMSQEQANLTENFGLLLARLTDPPDSDGNGVSDFVPVSDLHVGVISGDMGTGGYVLAGCEDAVDGDDGVLLHARSPAVATCVDEYPSFLSLGEGDDPGVIAQDFACIGSLGNEGCGFQQPFKAIHKALAAHRTGANAGFLRDDSVLAILLVSDGDDCSTREDIADATDLFDPELPLGPADLRCYSHRERYVTPVEEIARSLVDLRRCHPERLVVSGIVGIPPTIGCNLANMKEVDFQCVLDHSAMQEVVDESEQGRGERLTPSCDVPGLGEARPPRRIVEILQQVHWRTFTGGVTSICAGDWRPAMDEIARGIHAAVRR